MTYREKLTELLDESAASREEFSVLSEEIYQLIMKGEDFEEKRREKNFLFDKHSTFVQEHSRLVSHITINKIRLDDEIPKDLLF